VGRGIVLFTAKTLAAFRWDNELMHFFSSIINLIFVTCILTAVKYMEDEIKMEGENWEIEGTSPNNG
jgi:hypothetical protein